MAWYNSGNWSGLTVGTDLSYILRDLVLALNERRTFAGLSAITVNTMNGSKSSPVQADFVGTPVAEIGTRYITPLRNGVESSIISASTGKYVHPSTHQEWLTLSSFLTDAGIGSAWTANQEVSGPIYAEIKQAIDYLTVFTSRSELNTASALDRYTGSGSTQEAAWDDATIDSPGFSTGLYSRIDPQIPLGSNYALNEARNNTYTMGPSYSGVGTVLETRFSWALREVLLTTPVSVSMSTGHSFSFNATGGSSTYRKDVIVSGDVSGSVTIDYDPRPSTNPFSSIPNDGFGFLSVGANTNGTKSNAALVYRVIDVSGDVSY